MGILENFLDRLDAIEAKVDALAERAPTASLPSDEGPEYMDTVGAAAFLGVSKQSMALWRSKGEGPKYSKVGGTVRYSRSALRSWMEENER